MSESTEVQSGTEAPEASKRENLTAVFSTDFAILTPNK